MAKLLMISDGWRLQNGWRGGAPCFGGRTISFLVKFESFVLCKLELYISHLGYFVSNLMNKKQIIGSKFSKKKLPKKQKKILI